MNTIFDEVLKAEQLLADKPKDVNKKDLIILIKYYKHSGHTKKETMEKIREFCSQVDPEFNFVVARDMLKSIEKVYDLCGIKIPKDVCITRIELDTIKSLNDRKKECVLFTLLVLSKFYHNSGSNYYVNDVRETTLFRLAGVNAKKEERNDIIYSLNQSGLISIPSARYKSVKINFVDCQSDVSITVRDMNNIYKSYPFYCSVCREPCDRKGRNQKMCERCWSEHRKEWDRNRKKNQKKGDAE